tara:strand:- start:1451 stop:2431 length:981 start_codon:yes stop_codon:yes gene_type:complete
MNSSTPCLSFFKRSVLLLLLLSSPLGSVNAQSQIENVKGQQTGNDRENKVSDKDHPVGLLNSLTRNNERKNSLGLGTAKFGDGPSGLSNALDQFSEQANNQDTRKAQSSAEPSGLRNMLEQHNTLNQNKRIGSGDSNDSPIEFSSDQTRQQSDPNHTTGLINALTQGSSRNERLGSTGSSVTTSGLGNALNNGREKSNSRGFGTENSNNSPNGIRNVLQGNAVRNALAIPGNGDSAVNKPRGMLDVLTSHNERRGSQINNSAARNDSTSSQVEGLVNALERHNTKLNTNTANGDDGLDSQVGADGGGIGLIDALIRANADSARGAQ